MKKTLFYIFISITGFVNAQYTPTVFPNLYTGNQPGRGVNFLNVANVVNDQMFFSARKNDNSLELYVTDGTQANTRLLQTNAAPAPSIYFMPFDNHVYFLRYDNVNRLELWKSDGTLSGTTLVFNIGGASSTASGFKVIGNKLFFGSPDAESYSNTRLYMLEAGSNTPTLLSTTAYNINNITEFNGKIYFVASEELFAINYDLYTSDGTISGTQKITNFPGVHGVSINTTRNLASSEFTVFQNKLFFIGDDGISGREIWSTDGTINGTQQFKDIYPGIVDGVVSTDFGIYNDKLYFSATNGDGSIGQELWSTDGTPANTSMVKNISAQLSSNPSSFVPLNGRLLFKADDGIHGTELWETYGTAETTSLVKDIYLGNNSGITNLFKENALCPTQLFFGGLTDIGDYESWVTDGTAAGTYKLIDINPSDWSTTSEQPFLLLNHKIYFVGESGNGRQLYVMDENCPALNISSNSNVNFKIYPNPTKNIVNIETTAEISTIEIYTTLGQLINTISENKTQIDLSGLNSGIYFLNITTTDNQKSVQRIIKE